MQKKLLAVAVLSTFSGIASSNDHDHYSFSFRREENLFPPIMILRKDNNGAKPGEIPFLKRPNMFELPYTPKPNDFKKKPLRA